MDAAGEWRVDGSGSTQHALPRDRSGQSDRSRTPKTETEALRPRIAELEAVLGQALARVAQLGLGQP